jgi:hypothetical protein
MLRRELGMQSRVEAQAALINGGEQHPNEYQPFSLHPLAFTL